MCSSLYIQNEAKKNLKEWTYEGLSFLLQQQRFREMAITALSKFLELNQSVEFTYNGFFYEVFESADSGLCTGSAKDAIEFML